MKKLLVATLLLVLAALTETPEDYNLSGTRDKLQMDAYLSVWANAEAEGFIAEDLDSTVPLNDVQTDQGAFERDANMAI